MFRKGVNPKEAWGDKKLKVQWVPPTVICGMAKALEEGGRKYGPYNWRETSVESMTYYGGAMRHLLAWLDGEDLDPDSENGKHHLEGALASLAILYDAVVSGYVIDNRPSKGGSPEQLLQGARRPNDI